MKGSNLNLITQKNFKYKISFFFLFFLFFDRQPEECIKKKQDEPNVDRRYAKGSKEPKTNRQKTG